MSEDAEYLERKIAEAREELVWIKHATMLNIHDHNSPERRIHRTLEALTDAVEHLAKQA